MVTTAAPDEDEGISGTFLVFLIVISVIVIVFIISIVIWGFWKYRKVKRREIERCSNCRCDTLKEHDRCRSCDIPPTEDELREAEENLIYHRCPCIPPWRSRVTKIAVNGGYPTTTVRDPAMKTSGSHVTNESRTNGVAHNNNKPYSSKTNGSNGAILKRNGAANGETTPVMANGTVPKGIDSGGGVLEDVSDSAILEDNQPGSAEVVVREVEEEVSAAMVVAASPVKSAGNEMLERGEGEKSATMIAGERDGRKLSSSGAKPPSTGPSKGSTHREKVTPSDADAAPDDNSASANAVPPLELKGLNEESSDVEKGKRRKTRRKMHEDSYESSEENISTPRKPTVIHIGKSGVTIGGSNEEGASTPRIKIGGHGSISLGNSTISLGGAGASSQISLGNHLGGSTITVGGGEDKDGKLTPQVLRIGSRTSRRSGRYDGKHFHHSKSRHHSYSGRSSAGSRCSTQISFSNGMTLVLDEEDETDSPRGQTERSKIRRRRHESQGGTSVHKYPNGWSRQSDHVRHASTARDETSGHRHHRHSSKVHPYRSYTTRDNHSPTATTERKIRTKSQQDPKYSPRR